MMSKRGRFMKLNKKFSAFSLAEAMFALLITILCIELLMGALGVVKTANKSREPVNELAFAYVQLERFMAEYEHWEIDLQQSTSKKVVLKALIEKKDDKPIFKTYNIVKHKNMIRMSGAQGGHMPLLLGVQQVDFDYQENFFVMNIVGTDKRKSNLIFKTDLPLPETTKDTEKKDAKDKEKKKTTNSDQSSS